MLFGQSGCYCCPPISARAQLLPIKWWSASEGASTSVAMAKVENKSGERRPLERNSFLLSRAASLLLEAENNIQLVHINNQADIRLPRQFVSFYVTNHPHSCEDRKFFRRGGRGEETLADWNELFKKPLFGLLPFRSGLLTLKFYQGFSSSNDVLFSASTRASTVNFSASPPPKILRTHDDFIIDVIWWDVRGK